MLKMKEIFADALMRKMEEKPLRKISVADLLETTGAARQTFYNHFSDINDLIQYIYTARIHAPIADIELSEVILTHHKSLTYHNFVKYKSFIIQACQLGGQNNLREFMVDYFVKWYTDRLVIVYGDEPIPEEKIFLLRFTANGAINMSIDWMEGGCRIPAEEFASKVAACYHPQMIALFSAT